LRFKQVISGILVGLLLPFLIIGGVVFISTPRHTAPSRVTFIDESNNTPIKGLRVKFTWLAAEGFLAVGSSWAYHTEELTTAADGSVTLPRIKKPFPVNFLVYQRDHLDIWVHFRSWQYEDQARYGYGVYGPYKIHGNEKEATIKLIPAANLDAEIGALDLNSGVFGKEFWQEGITAIVAKHGLPAISTMKLSLIADTCAKYKGASCEEFDREVLRRHGNDTKDLWARRAALRLGIVTPEMVERLRFWEERNIKGQPGSGEEQQEAAAIRQVVENSRINDKTSPTRH